MSAGAVFQEALRVVNGQRLPPVSHRSVVAVMEAARPGPLAFFYAAGREAGLTRLPLLTRGAALYLAFSAVNLCDDLNDGECTYLPDAERTGPCVQFILHHLVFATLAKAGLPPTVLSAAAYDLTAAGGAQRLEMATTRWTAPVFKTVGEGIAGRQWAAYLRLLWHGTPLAPRAARVGMHAGIAAHVAEDVRSSDRRYVSLPPGDKRKVIAWAMASVRALRRERLTCLDSALQSITPVLEKAG